MADKCLVGVVVVHQRALAGLRLAVAEVEALGDRRSRAWAEAFAPTGEFPVSRRLEADDVEQLPPALGQRAVGQAAVGAFQAS